ncbi:glycosyltransferase family 4 protein [Vibrio breoganii]
MKILFVGSLPPPIGGTTISFKMLTDIVFGKKLRCEPVLLNLSSYKTREIRSLLYMIFDLIKEIYKSDVVTLHLTIYSFRHFGLFAALVSKLLGKKIVIRRFGGGVVGDFTGISRFLLICLYKLADAGFMQTKRQLSEAESLGLKSQWLPTSRIPPTVVKQSNIAEKFIFVGHVKEDKGIVELINVFTEFSKKYKDCTLDIYGPDFIDVNRLIDCPNISFKGVIPNSNIYQTLENYDVMVFPTFYSGEGYPGVLIEGLHSGLPIITTRWKSIPELIDSSTGILVDIHQEKQLYKALENIHLNSDLYKRLSTQCLQESQKFDANLLAESFLDFLYELNTGKD